MHVPLVSDLDSILHATWWLMARFTVLYQVHETGSVVLITSLCTLYILLLNVGINRHCGHCNCTYRPYSRVAANGMQAQHAGSMLSMSTQEAYSQCLYNLAICTLVNVTSISTSSKSLGLFNRTQKPARHNMAGARGSW